MSLHGNYQGRKAEGRTQSSYDLKRKTTHSSMSNRRKSLLNESSKRLIPVFLTAENFSTAHFSSVSSESEIHSMRSDNLSVVQQQKIRYKAFSHSENWTAAMPSPQDRKHLTFADNHELHGVGRVIFLMEVEELLAHVNAFLQRCVLQRLQIAYISKPREHIVQNGLGPDFRIFLCYRIGSSRETNGQHAKFSATSITAKEVQRDVIARSQRSSTHLYRTC